MKRALIVEVLPDIRDWLVNTAETAFPGVQGEPLLSPPIARRVLAHFASGAQQRQALVAQLDDEVGLTERETEVLQRVAKGYTLPEIAQQFGRSRHTVAEHILGLLREQPLNTLTNP